MKPRPKKYSRSRLDATDIFDSEELREYDFGHVDIEEVQICEMGVKKVEGEIRYKSVGGFKLTSTEVEEKGDLVVADKEDLEGENMHKGNIVPGGKDTGNVEVQGKVEHLEIPARVKCQLD